MDELIPNLFSLYVRISSHYYSFRVIFIDRGTAFQTIHIFSYVVGGCLLCTWWVKIEGRSMGNKTSFKQLNLNRWNVELRTHLLKHL